MALDLQKNVCYLHNNFISFIICDENGCTTNSVLYLYYNSPYLCRCSQTADRNSCSIVSGDVSNCS